MRYRTSLALGVLILLLSCAGQKKVGSPAEWKGNSLQFGSGGGFTGATTRYTLLENGQLFKETGVTDMKIEQLPRVSKNKTKELFVHAAKIEWGDNNISEPGNMSTMLSYTYKGKKVEIVWGKSDYTPNEHFVKLYKDLNSIVSNSEKR